MICEVAGLTCEVGGGKEGRTVVLLHGWGCDHSFLKPQFRHFASRGPVIAPDLPGHGGNQANGNVSVKAMSQAVARLLAELRVSNALIVGHSMGGNIALELSLIAPRIVAGLVLIDSALWPADDLTAAARAVVELLNDGRRNEALDSVVEALSIPTDDPEVLSRFRRSCKGVPSNILAEALLDQIIYYDPSPAVSAVRSPIVYIGSERPLSSFITLATALPMAKTGQIVGSGHFAPLLVPEQVNAMLDGFVNSALR